MNWSKKLYRILFVLYFFLLFLWNDEIVYAKTIAEGYVTDTEGNRCGTLYWTLDSDGTFVVTGSGEGACYRPYGEAGFDALCPWDAYRNQIKRVEFRCNFTGTSLYHFEYGASINSWFVNCVNLQSCSDIPYGVTDMTATFFGCVNLKECGKIPDSVKVMHYTFSGCKSLVVSPDLSGGLKDYCYPRYKDEIIHEPCFGLGMTYEGCTSLVSTPSFENCTNLVALVGTFVDCTNLVTIQNIPKNINYLFNTFTNCKNVRGVLSCEANEITLQGMPFGNISQNNEYLLFVKANDSTLFEKIKAQAGGNFRGYEWNDDFTVVFDTNGANALGDRVIHLKYGSNYCGGICEDYKKHIAASYYNEPIISKGSLPIPIKEGLTFDGWYYDSGFSKPVNENNVINPNAEELISKKITLYAKWVDKKSPDIISDYLDMNWHNKPVTIHFKLSDNENGGIRFVELRKLEDDGKTVYEHMDTKATTTYEFSYTFGNVKEKLYEGITNWEVYSEDLSGNEAVINLTLRLDYTPPDIYTDIGWIAESEILYDDRDMVKIWCEDVHSGPGLLRMNPSSVQNTFVDFVVTPYVTDGVVLDYEYNKPDEEYGYVVNASDKAGNESFIVIVTRNNIASHIWRVVLRENYD